MRKYQARFGEGYGEKCLMGNSRHAYSTLPFQHLYFLKCRIHCISLDKPPDAHGVSFKTNRARLIILITRIAWKHGQSA